MNIIISNTSDKPIYQQIYEQISSQIINGEIKTDAVLPSIRTAAKELRVSIITVKKAWEELERNRFIYTRTGKGCFVSNLSQGDKESMKQTLAEEQMKKDILYYQELGLTVDEVTALVKSCWE